MRRAITQRVLGHSQPLGLVIDDGDEPVGGRLVECAKLCEVQQIIAHATEGDLRVFRRRLPPIEIASRRWGWFGFRAACQHADRSGNENPNAVTDDRDDGEHHEQPGNDFNQARSPSCETSREHLALFHHTTPSIWTLFDLCAVNRPQGALGKPFPRNSAGKLVPFAAQQTVSAPSRYRPPLGIRTKTANIE
jgi:hypothetical protein